jgi:heme exporter protein D
MPDLGRYALHVLSAYGVALAVLGGLTGASLGRWRSLRREVEQRERGRG